MKLLMENWRGFLIEEGGEPMVMYHSTTPENIENVLANGLESGGGRSVYTDEHADWADKFYKGRPVFLSLEKGRYAGEPLEINVNGLPLIADLASVADLGDMQPSMEYNFGDGYVMEWLEGVEPQELKSIMNDRMQVSIDAMLKPGSEAAQLAITATGTAAVLETIPPERIKK